MSSRLVFLFVVAGDPKRPKKHGLWAAGLQGRRLVISISRSSLNVQRPPFQQPPSVLRTPYSSQQPPHHVRPLSTYVCMCLFFAYKVLGKRSARIPKPKEREREREGEKITFLPTQLPGLCGACYYKTYPSPSLSLSLFQKQGSPDS